MSAPGEEEDEWASSMAELGIEGGAGADKGAAAKSTNKPAPRPETSGGGGGAGGGGGGAGGDDGGGSNGGPNGGPNGGHNGGGGGGGGGGGSNGSWRHAGASDGGAYTELGPPPPPEDVPDDPVLLEAVFNPRERRTILKYEDDVRQFMGRHRETQLRFPSASGFHRMLLHKLAARFNLEHHVEDLDEEANDSEFGRRIDRGRDDDRDRDRDRDRWDDDRN
eukprot:g6430.t1